MPLPTQQQLDDERARQKKQISELKSSYVAFLAQWEDLEHQEHELMEQLHGEIDKAQLHDILKKIESIDT